MLPAKHSTAPLPFLPATRWLHWMPLLMLGWCFFVVGSCSSDGKRDIEAYYFPVKNLRKGQVYEYAVSNKDSIALEYWYYRGFVRDSGLFLAGTYYDQRFQIGQIIREKITQSGAIARECHLYEPGENAEAQQIHIPTVIESPNLFPFSVRDSSGTFEFKLHFSPSDDPETVMYLHRRRRFVGDAPDFEYDGKNYDCIRFAIHEAISTRKDGKPDLESFGEERYAKGLGLVYYSKSYGKNAFKVEGRLTDIISMETLEERASAVFGQ
jgi:hypothetical protein